MVCRSPLPCPCGRPYVRLTAMGGRAEDMLRLPRQDGNGEVSITPMIISLAIERQAGVREYAADHDATGITIRLVVPDARDRERIGAGVMAQLRADIARQGAQPPPIELRFVEHLARSVQRMGKINIVARRRSPPLGTTAGP